MLNKKGFFFVVTSLILLTYIMANLSLWSQTVSIQEERYSEDFRISNIDFAASQITPDELSYFSETAVDFALFKITMHSIENPVSPGPNEERLYENIEKAVHDLIINGQTSSSQFETVNGIEYAFENYSSYTFEALFDELNNSFSKIGMIVSDPEITDFSLEQNQIDTLDVSFNLYFTVVDKYSTYASLERSIPIELELPISGLLDPSVSREMLKDDFNSQEVEKQIFFYDEEEFEEFDPEEDLVITREGTEKGQGWFYGYVYDAKKYVPEPEEEGEHEDPPDSLKSRFVLMGNISDIYKVQDYGSYGAYLIISNQNFSEVRFEIGNEKPFFLSDSQPSFFSCDIAGNLNVNNDTPECFFFVSELDPESSILNDPNPSALSEYYDIESFRDFVICGYYFHDPEGPSYLQKFFLDSYNYEGGDFGIASFLLWEDIESGEGDDLSRLDLEFFNGESGTIIKGMPGCKDIQMCSEIGKFVGQFKLSDSSIENYLTDGEDADDAHFLCDDWASCEVP